MILIGWHCYEAYTYYRLYESLIRHPWRFLRIFIFKINYFLWQSNKVIMLIFVNVICFLSPFIRETRLSSNMGYIGLFFSTTCQVFTFNGNKVICITIFAKKWVICVGGTLCTNTNSLSCLTVYSNINFNLNKYGLICVSDTGI